MTDVFLQLQLTYKSELASLVKYVDTYKDVDSALKFLSVLQDDRNRIKCEKYIIHSVSVRSGSSHLMTRTIDS